MLQEIGQIVTAVGVVLAWLSLRANNRQRQRQFETIYVQRYWSLMDRLSPQATVEPPSRLSDDDRVAARAYLQLCEDELELRAAGWIGTATWVIWRDGIVAQVKRAPFSVVWDEIKTATADLLPTEGDFQYLREFMRDGDPRDPLKKLPLRTRVGRALRPAP